MNLVYKKSWLSIRRKHKRIFACRVIALWIRNGILRIFKYTDFGLLHINLRFYHVNGVKYNIVKKIFASSLKNIPCDLGSIGGCSR